MKNDICIACNGKGFHWKAGALKNQRTGEIIADIASKGDNCTVCKGTGKRPNWVAQMLGCFGVAALFGVVVLALLAIF